MLADLNLNLLRSFFLIAEERSLTRAAARLNMSQPSVSQALQRLEEQLGCQLVLRGSRKFELTAPGQKVFEECSEIFEAVERIAQRTQERAVEEFGEVRIQIISNLETPLINEALGHMDRRGPEQPGYDQAHPDGEVRHRVLSTFPPRLQPQLPASLPGGIQRLLRSGAPLLRSQGGGEA